MMTCEMPTVPGRYQCLVRVKDKRLLEFRDIWLFPGEGHWRFAGVDILTVYYPALELYRPIGHIDDDQAVILLSAIMTQAVKDAKCGAESDRSTAMWFLNGSETGRKLLKDMSVVPLQINHSVAPVRMRRGKKHYDHHK